MPVVGLVGLAVLAVVVTTAGSADLRQWQALEMRADPCEVGAFFGSRDFGVAR